MSYVSKSSLVQDQQLVVQELDIMAGTDLGLYTQSGSTVTTCLMGEPVLLIYSAEVLPAAGGDVICNAADDNSIVYVTAVVDGVTLNVDSQMVIDLAVYGPLMAGDVLRLKYTTQQ